MRFLIYGALLTGLSALVPLGLAAQEGSLDPTFNADDVGYGHGDNAAGSVYASVRQPDGKLVIAGTFTSYNDVACGRIVRLNADGTLDGSFNTGTGVDATIRALALQTDGKVILGGEFSNVQGTPRKRLARLNQNGTLDTSFDPGPGADSTVMCLALQPDGHLIAGGDFTHVNGVQRNRFVRLSSTGEVDPLFNLLEGANNTVLAIIALPDYTVMLGGRFTMVFNLTRPYFTRVDIYGNPTTPFQPGLGPQQAVHCMALQSDGRIVIGGEFASYNGTYRDRIARVNANGSLDTSFDPGSGTINYIYTMALQPNGKIVIGGNFPYYNGVVRDNIARVLPDGSLDTGFDPGSGTSSTVRVVLALSNTSTFLGGQFRFYNGFMRRGIAMLANAAPDPAFNYGTGANRAVYALAQQSDGKILAVGTFTLYNGQPANCLIRLLPNGQQDPTFNTGIGFGESTTHAIVVRPDGKIIVGGSFSSYNTHPCNDLVRLNADGTYDETFSSGTNGYVRCMTLQADGKILIGGTFTTVNGLARRGIARLLPDGPVDTGFDPGSLIPTNPNLTSVAVRADGKVLFCHSNVVTYNGQTRASPVQLNADGSYDVTFNTGYGCLGAAGLAIQPDGKVIVTGNFTSANGVARGRIARFNVDGSLDTSFNPGTGFSNTGDTPSVPFVRLLPDGRMVAVGLFDAYRGTSRIGVVVILPDGNLDTAFDPGSGAVDHYVASIDGPFPVSCALDQQDGRILIGGQFTSYNGTGRNRIARINGTARASIKVMLDGPYAAGTMTDALRTLPSFPLTEPFTAMGYAETGYVSGATIGSSVLTATGNNAIVDWVLVEMRPVATPGTIAASRAVLLQRDGDVVDLDGVSTVGFAGLAAGNYCVAVKPRNHLPVMLSATTPVSYGAAVATVDFTLPTTQVYDNDARKNVGGVMVLAAGDVTFNETLTYTGSGNDRDPILSRVGSTTPNNTLSGYWREDVNMDGVVKYTGTNNDRDIILTNVGSTTPNNTRVATLP